ncbi:hypothetical protein [Zhongshania aliphaticivorans]|uniref:hypothetical protein n=1 Tax=Zhongshania aliphaticivorans TaxID=1470434 RepID=UPI001330C7C4|nr:hypothetical protein [Zhongshania aliphaticivorans]
MADLGLMVRRVPFCAVDSVLSSAFGNDRDIIREEVEKGFAQCWEIGQAAVITRREDSELVVVCMAGKGAVRAGEVIVQAAKKSGCKTIRFHTERPALGRLLAPLGAELREYVFQIRV